MSKNVIERVIFQTQQDMDKEQFLQLSHELNKVLKSNMTGFIKRLLTKDLAQDKWVEMIWWESMEAAQAALDNLPQVVEFQKYCSVLSDEETKMFHLEKMV